MEKECELEYVASGVEQYMAPEDPRWLEVMGFSVKTVVTEPAREPHVWEVSVIGTPQ